MFRPLFDLGSVRTCWQDGLERASEEGTPQGGSLSALLSNVYLHYVLDLWFERRFKPSCRGEVYLFRYADDFLVCLQHRDEAEEFLRQLKERFEQFHLVLSESKTKLVAFGRFAREDAQRKGKKLQTFEFLGFTHLLWAQPQRLLQGQAPDVA